MVARSWRGWTRAADADAYADYLEETGVPALAGTPGNEGVQVWRRVEGDRAEFVVVSLWGSLEDVRAFAGDDVEEARFYPEDGRFLVERDGRVTHYEIVASR